jgi:hypothetical protein
MRRHDRRVLDELAARDGMGDAFWADQKRVSERRMGIIDQAPREWRDLVNRFDPDEVADMAGRGYGVVEAERCLRQKFGDPV